MTRPSEPHDHNTGLTYAPKYDKTTELDSREVEAVTLPSADVSKLEYFQKQHAKRTLIARSLLLTVIFGMLAANAWLTQRNYNALLINVNQARLEQSLAMDKTDTLLADVSSKIATLQAGVDALQSEPLVEGEPAEPVVANR